MSKTETPYPLLVVAFPKKEFLKTLQSDTLNLKKLQDSGMVLMSIDSDESRANMFHEDMWKFVCGSGEDYTVIVDMASMTKDFEKIKKFYQADQKITPFDALTVFRMICWRKHANEDTTNMTDEEFRKPPLSGAVWKIGSKEHPRFISLYATDEHLITDDKFELYRSELLKGVTKKTRKKSYKLTRKPLPKGIRYEVFLRDNYTCTQCGAKKKEGVVLHIDHILPVSKGGTDEMSNLRTFCEICNLNKSDLIQGGRK